MLYLIFDLYITESKMLYIYHQVEQLFYSVKRVFYVNLYRIFYEKWNKFQQTIGQNGKDVAYQQICGQNRIVGMLEDALYL